MRLLGKEQKFFGRVELITYENCAGKDLFAAARPPATGILGCGFRVEFAVRHGGPGAHRRTGSPQY